jgi:hypothetical protein
LREINVFDWNRPLALDAQRRRIGYTAGTHTGRRRMTKIEIELPEAIAKAARDAGLLTSQALDPLLTDALNRRDAADQLLSIVDRVAAAGVEPMSMEEIDAEVKVERATRK